MDPITLAAVTSAITVLGTKVVEGVAGEAAKTLWSSVMRLFQWERQPPLAEIPRRAAEYLQKHPEHAVEILRVLGEEKGSVGALVGSIEAEKVVVAHHIGTLNM